MRFYRLQYFTLSLISKMVSCYRISFRLPCQSFVSFKNKLPWFIYQSLKVSTILTIFNYKYSFIIAIKTCEILWISGSKSFLHIISYFLFFFSPQFHMLYGHSIFFKESYDNIILYDIYILTVHVHFKCSFLPDFYFSNIYFFTLSNRITNFVSWLMLQNLSLDFLRTKAFNLYIGSRVCR